MSMTASSPLPAIETVDPLPPGRVAMWLVIASDLMFFVGLVGAFVVLRTGNLDLFANHQKGLSKGLAGAGVLVLVASSCMMAVAVRAAQSGALRRACLALLATLLCGGAFVAFRSTEYAIALNHHTIVARMTDDSPLVLFDGSLDWWNGDPVKILDGYTAPLPPDFDAHIVSEDDVARLSSDELGNHKQFTLPQTAFEDIRYGPGKNIFYASWYLLTAAHLVHVAAAMVAVAVLLLRFMSKQLKPVHVELVGYFWHFTVFVGVFLFPLLYVI